MRTSVWRAAAVIAAILGVTAAIELMMGRLPWCRCGYVKLWHGVVFSSENSQHITDWYSFTHVTHGIAFYGLFRLVARRVPLRTRFVLAVVLESAWEIVENSPFVIDRYRTATISLDYYGDSVINSIADVCAMMGGFWIATVLPAWASFVLVIAMELALAYFIRDNLALNILMLLRPVEAVRRWQSGG